MNEFRKSSYSGANGQCVEVGWRKSAHSMTDGHCAEIRQHGPLILVRDTKDPGTGPVLSFPQDAWKQFIHRMRTA